MAESYVDTAAIGAGLVGALKTREWKTRGDPAASCHGDPNSKI